MEQCKEFYLPYSLSPALPHYVHLYFEKMELVLGIDGGGTSTACLLADMSGSVVAKAYAPASNHRKSDLGEARDALSNGVNAVLSQVGKCPKEIEFASVCAGLAGVDTKDDAAVLQNLLADIIKTENLQVVNDGEIALAGALEDEAGILVISGTGSIVWANGKDGQRIRVGGWDYMLSDEGSAYDIGSKVLRAVAAAHDGRIEKTQLTDYVLEAFQARDFDELLGIIYHEEMTPQRIASLALFADNAANDGDAVAEKVLLSAANELVKLVEDAMRLSGLHESGFPVVPMGGVLQANGYFSKTFRAAMNETLPRAHFIEPHHTPAEGAVLLALKALNNRLEYRL